MRSPELVLNLTWWSTAIGGAVALRTQLEWPLIGAILGGIGLGLVCVLAAAGLIQLFDREG